MAVIRLQGYIIVPSNELAVVRSALDSHIILTRDEAGCLIFRVVQDGDNPCRFEVFEEFVDRKAFDAHQRRVAQSEWGRVTVNVERYYKLEELP